MAEAVVTARPSDDWKAVNAGTEPAGHVCPFASMDLIEMGMAHKGRTKGATQSRDVAFDLVIKVCGDAVENCSVWLGRDRREHLGFCDPAMAKGTHEEKRAVFRAVRDEIGRRVPALIHRWAAENH